MTTGSALPKLPQSVPRGLLISWLHWFASATACQVARPPVRIRLDRPAFGDFYFQAFNGSVSLSVAGYNYNSGWISFCWRDLHPLEWQLASLHGQKAKYSLRAHIVRFAPESGLKSDIAGGPFRADIVAKVPKGGAANFSPKNETSDNRRSIGLQTRYQNRL